jgi:hypothetical protein
MLASCVQGVVMSLCDYSLTCIAMYGMCPSLQQSARTAQLCVLTGRGDARICPTTTGCQMMVLLPAELHSRLGAHCRRWNGILGAGSPKVLLDCFTISPRHPAERAQQKIVGHQLKDLVAFTASSSIVPSNTLLVQEWYFSPG